MGSSRTKIPRSTTVCGRLPVCANTFFPIEAFPQSRETSTLQMHHKHRSR